MRHRAVRQYHFADVSTDVSLHVILQESVLWCTAFTPTSTEESTLVIIGSIERFEFMNCPLDVHII